ncbi:PREDICTED: pentatricopeptide repeat-containing protein At1g74750-like isoform X2 [Nicotiana attenuata]|uniref:Pentatricopeptide repeat-containing protein n=2 Tax=Nicotiana attenuata TaxID=49451 RepID=A0A1J6JCT9_NICAT|nr:PREDICTED: pentatricopeptide repeat-containing protein At1g74750-like isoform X2 [Nicotiana attenuata]XP_019243677.1 PREDICTED: pentatricopeptide repeat-containing protein At1g74750-like isoform X2 [Nicotiana attenuata]XP_019243678.1 PREDICTED: pentatricopeptide repeat-containing protein At1g74750-like isoform X2 [Nicotiana attenuata]OIT04897.1 pentatricopeptide repeat-containing protein [Nicotiana attenuata]
MLRAKHLGTLSQSARSFFLSGSRCSAADGSSCTCSEDETCISKRPQTRNEVRHPQISSSLVSKASVGVGALLSGDTVKVVSSKKNETLDSPVSRPQAIPASTVSGRVESVIYSSIDAENTVQSSPPISDQFVRAGIAAVSFLSDVVNYKIPMLDGSGEHSSSNNCMVDRTKPMSNVRPSNVKTSRNDKLQANTSTDTPVTSNLANDSNCTKSRGDKYNSVKGRNPVLNNSTGEVETRGVVTDSRDRRRTMPPKSKTYPNRNMANVRASEGKLKNEIPEGFSRPLRETKSQNAGVVPMVRQFSNSGHVVGTVSRILQQLNWGSETENALRELNCLLDPYQANQILKQIHDHTVALGFFYWLKRQPGFKHDGHTYTTMVGLLGRARQFGAINKLLEQMVKDGCQPNVVTYNRLIHSYGRANYLREALHVFNEMQEARVEPDRVTYCTLIDIHAKAGYLDVAMDLYERMQEAGLSPDTFTYSVIINCLGKAGHLAAAHKLFCEMVNQGCVPNLVTYNIMIALHAKARNYSSALQLYRDMQNAGFEPDKVTYSIVMEVLGHCGYLEEAEAVFTEMKRKNWVPDEPVYGLLVDLWGKAGNVEKAWNWYCAMINAGLCPNVPTCNSLLSAFLRVHRLPDAYNLLQSMLELGLNPSLQTYTLLLSCCTEAQTSFDMSFCCELMAVTRHPAHTFLLTMPPAGPDGQNVRDHVSSFLDLMHSEDRESKRGLVDAVVDFMHKSGLKEEAGSVWEVAAHKNVYPDAVREKSSCYWLINLHVMSDGTAIIALSRTLAWFRRQMLISGICPSRIDIVTGWGRRSRVTGSSLVRQAVQELLNMFGFPFLTQNGNSGCFVGCGEPLTRWLVQPYVERMHLL